MTYVRRSRAICSLLRPLTPPVSLSAGKLVPRASRVPRWKQGLQGQSSPTKRGLARYFSEKPMYIRTIAQNSTERAVDKGHDACEKSMKVPATGNTRTLWRKGTNGHSGVWRIGNRRYSAADRHKTPGIATPQQRNKGRKKGAQMMQKGLKGPGESRGIGVSETQTFSPYPVDEFTIMLTTCTGC